MQEMKVYHSRQICGIVAHVKDRGVASASIRCLAVAGENLTSRREQEEVLQIFDRIKKETGWRVTFIHDDLKEKWGWNSNAQDYDSMSSGSTYYPPSGSSSTSGAPGAHHLVRSTHVASSIHCIRTRISRRKISLPRQLRSSYSWTYYAQHHADVWDFRNRGI